MQHKNYIVVMFLLIALMVLSACSEDPRTAQGASLPTATPTATPEVVTRSELTTILQQDRKELLSEIEDMLENRQSNVPEPTANPTTRSQENNVEEPEATATPRPQGTDVEEPETNIADNSNPVNDEATPVNCTFAEPGNLDDMPKTVIEMAQEGKWFHRVFNERLFRAPDWGGADSWFVQLALGPNSGGFWTDMGNPGQIVYRGENTTLEWCLGVLTESDWKDQFMVGEGGDAAINVRIAPNSPIWVVGPGGTFEGVSSDAGDITIILPDEGEITIGTRYSTAAPTHESHVWWGPYDRSKDINTIDPR